MIKLRTLPGGWMGLLMILTGVLSLTSSLATSQVAAAPHADRCVLDSGVVILGANASQHPSPYVGAALYSQNAQLITSYTLDIYNNTGQQGIYKGFNPSTLNEFFATDVDIAGFWTCKTSTPQPLIFTNETDQDIAQELASAGYLYKDSFWYQSVKLSASSEMGYQLVIASVSSDVLGDSWDLKFAVDIQDDRAGLDKQIEVQACTLEFEYPLVDTIRRQININATMNLWMPFFQANLYTGFDSESTAVDSIGQQLEILLNSIIMTAGSKNSVDINAADLTYGCIFYGTWIDDYVIVFVLLTGGIVLFLIVDILSLQIRLSRSKSLYNKRNVSNMIDSEKLCRSVPNSILDWIAHSAKLSDDRGNHSKHCHLREWLMSTCAFGGRHVGLVQKRENGYTDAATFTPASAPHTPMASFFNHKTGYDPVRTTEVSTPSP